MADNFRVLDVAVGELAANLNALSDDPWVIISQAYYTRHDERRVTVLLAHARTQLSTGMPVDPRRIPRN
jgi:hypothetical protein